MIDKIAIVYQDDSIIAVNKPPFLSVFPKESKHEKDSLFGILKKQISSKIFPVHSIDKDASGIIIFAKNEKARLFLSSQFKDSLIKREFIVLLSGVLENDEAIIEEPILISKKEIALDNRGKRAVTQYQVLEKFQGYTLVLAKPITQMRSQIRLHFYSIGHPLAIDPLYSSGAPIFLSSFKRKYKLKLNEKEKPLISRMPIHLSRLILKTADGEEKIISADLPKDFAITVKQLKKYYS